MTEQNTNATYAEQVKADFEEFFGEEYHQAKTENERYELVQQALDSDDVTGNGSGSYYMNRQKAKEQVLANLEYITNGMANEEWTTTPLEDFIASGDWESLDVITRYHTFNDLWEHDEL